MENHTLSATVFASRDVVYRFLADVENLPQWSPRFCERLELGHQGWRAYTTQGEMMVESEATETDDGTGFIQLRVGPSADKLGCIVLRVFPLAKKRTRVDFTLMQPSTRSEEPGENEGQGLLLEMQGLIRRFGGSELHGAEPALQLAALSLN